MEILESARRHDVLDTDIHHAIAYALSVDEVGEDPFRHLLLGPDTGGNLLEIVVLERPNGPCDIHAMKMRERYRELLPRIEEGL